jgi:hypothetical protein
MRLLLAIVAFFVFQASWFVRETPTERRLAAVAGDVAGAEVEVRCRASGGA